MGGFISKSDPPPVGEPEPEVAVPEAAVPWQQELGQVLKQGGITKVVLIRHANAQPRDPEANAAAAGEIWRPDVPNGNAWTLGDLMRGLTEKGEEQATAAKSSWFDALDLRAVICSEAIRATKTKETMTGGKFAKGEAGMLTLHTLHPSRSETPDCEKMFGKLGYGTLNTYYADASVEGCENRGREIFRGYMDKVTGELHTLIAEGIADFPKTGDTVAVFGHAVFLNAVAVAVAEAMGIDKAHDSIATMELGEAQGILCDAGKGVSLCVAA